MNPQEYKIYQTAKAQGKDDAFIKGAIQAYRTTQAPAAPAAPIQQADHGILGNMVAAPVKILARGATNLVQAGQIATGKPQTQPFSGSYLGEVKPIGGNGEFNTKNVADAFGVGLEAASYLPMAKGAGLTWDVLKNAATFGAKSGAERYMARETLKKAVPALMKEGALGGGTNAAGSSMQNNEGLGSTLFNTGVGTIGGGIAAPIIGVGGAGVGAAAGKYLNTRGLFGKALSKVTPDMNSKFMQELTQFVRSPLDTAEKAKMKAGRVETEYPSLFGKKQNVVSEHDAAMANSVKDLVDPRMSKTNENIAKVEQAVNEFHQNDFMPFLEKHDIAYDPQQLSIYLNNKMKPSSMLRPGGDNFYAFNQIKNKGLAILRNHQPTIAGIQQARSEIDNMITDEFGPAIWEKNPNMMAGVKEGAMKLRTVLNDYTHDSLAVGGDMKTFNTVEEFMKVAQQRGMKFDNVADIKEQLMKHFGSELLPENQLEAILFRNKLKDMNLKLEAVGNMWENSQKEVGKSMFQNVTNPYGKAALGAVGIGLGGIYLGRRTVGGGSQ